MKITHHAYFVAFHKCNFLYFTRSFHQRKSDQNIFFRDVFLHNFFFIILNVAWGHQSEVSRYLSCWSKRLPIFFPKRWAQRFRSMSDCIQFIVMLNASILIKGENKKCLVWVFESNGLWHSWKCIIYVHLYCTSHVYFIRCHKWGKII